MSHDEDDEAHTLIHLRAQFSPGHVGDVIHQELKEALDQVNGDTAAIARLIPYITNIYREDWQRQYAERELFRLQVSLAEAQARMQHCLAMLPESGRPVTIKT